MPVPPPMPEEEALVAARPDACREVEVEIRSPLTADVLRQLGQITEKTAFALTGVTPLEGGWRCRFTLTAGRGGVCDSHIFALLTAIGRHWPWTGVSRSVAGRATVERPAPPVAGEAPPESSRHQYGRSANI